MKKIITAQTTQIGVCHSSKCIHEITYLQIQHA